MTRRRRAADKPQRICAMCGGGIAEQRPVFLVGAAKGAIVGPYHAGCAARTVMELRKLPDQYASVYKEAEVYGYTRREETLPE